MNRAKRWKIFTAVLLTAAMITGCNTFKGMGKDIEGAGQVIQKASEKTQEAITK